MLFDAASFSFVSQCDHGVDAHGATGGNVAGGDGDDDQQESIRLQKWPDRLRSPEKSRLDRQPGFHY